MKSLSTLHIATLLLCLPAQTFCMETVLTEKYKISPLFVNQVTPEIFDSFLAKVIDKNNKNLFNWFKATWRTNQTKDSTKEIKNIENKLQQLRQEITDKKENFLLDIKKHCNISDENWEQYTLIINQLNSYHETQKNIALSNFKHDNNIPPSILSMLKTNLKENGINPERITLERITSQKLEDPIFVIESPQITGKFSINNVNDSLKITDFLQSQSPGIIKINPQSIDSWENKAQEGACIFLTAEVIRNFSYFEHILPMFSDIPINNNYFSKIEYTRTLLTLALKDLPTAQKINAFCRNLKNSNVCSTEDYGQLSEIHRLQKTLALLKEDAPNDPEKTITTEQAETH